MITITTLGSSSAGNAYLVDDGETKLLLEAGLPYKEIQRGTGFRISSLAGCLISHAHGDHSKSAEDLIKAGVDVYSSVGTFRALGIESHRAIAVQALQAFTIGTWRILPFDVQHDVEEPFGYLLVSKNGNKLLFATDSYFIKYRFSNITHLLIECNYSIKLLDENIANGSVPAVMRSRLLRSHFSLEHVKEFLRANDLSKVVEIHLLHLSDTNSDEELFKREIQALTGKVVRIAQK